MNSESMEQQKYSMSSSEIGEINIIEYYERSLHRNICNNLCILM